MHVDLTNSVVASKLSSSYLKTVSGTTPPPIKSYKILTQIWKIHKNNEICLENIGNPLKNGKVPCLVIWMPMALVHQKKLTKFNVIFKNVRHFGDSMGSSGPFLPILS